ncbi:unnamed protein product [Caenorhabditis auriculariae]|uniref:Cation efflux protein transmembrane domain-containing protein n=1 Tax=Caenorhabditis auriculariae TaxID=2777116 RepID=A0A8S1GZJ3_9PELO|nr:unnamed protein product [Caenorhabditis auriculariae]
MTDDGPSIVNDVAARRGRSGLERFVPKHIQDLIIMVIVSIGNVALMSAKIFVAYSTGSFSITTSAIESSADVFVSGTLMLQWLREKSNSLKSYPRGRNTEAATNIFISAVMLTLSVSSYLRSLERFVKNEVHLIVETHDVALVGANIVVKILFSFLCFTRRKSPRIWVLFKDQVVDIVANFVAFAALIISIKYFTTADLIGATLILIMIVFNWSTILWSSWNNSQGCAGTKKENAAILKILEENREFFVRYAGFLTFHTGDLILVEVYGDLMQTSRNELASLKEKITEIEHVAHVYFMNFDEAENLPLVEKDSGKNENLDGNDGKMTKNVTFEDYMELQPINSA